MNLSQTHVDHIIRIKVETKGPRRDHIGRGRFHIKRVVVVVVKR